MPITLTPTEQNQADALGCIAWALLDAEARDDRRGAGSIVPIFAASWNTWSSGIRRLAPSAPASLDVTAVWGAAHNTALQATLVTLLTHEWGASGVDADVAYDATLPAASGVVPNAFRGVWFETEFRPLYHTVLPEHAASQMQRGGASALSAYSAAVARGAGVQVAPVIPRSTQNVPNVPHQTTVPAGGGASFVLPLDLGGEGGAMVITGDPGGGAAFPVVPVLVGVTLLATAIGVGVYGSQHGWFR